MAPADVSRPAPAGRVAMLVTAMTIQALCAVFFVGDVVADLALGDDGDLLHSMIELVASAGMALGLVFLWRELRRLRASQQRMARQLGVARGAFQDVLEARFDDWALTPAERDVALMLVKGAPIAEIARLRQSAEGTVKAHCNKIYGKAGVSGRTELVSLFVEDLMADGLVGI